MLRFAFYTCIHVMYAFWIPRVLHSVLCAWNWNQSGTQSNCDVLLCTNLHLICSVHVAFLQAFYRFHRSCLYSCSCCIKCWFVSWLLVGYFPSFWWYRFFELDLMLCYYTNKYRLVNWIRQNAAKLTNSKPPIMMIFASYDPLMLQFPRQLQRTKLSYITR
jgi:hypothetical protein